MSRPLSPHLTWYKPQITSTLSILHRFTGIVLALGAVALSWWVAAVAIGGETYAGTAWLYTSIAGQIVLFGWTLALAFHLSNGIRHLFWDAGIGFDMPTVNRSGIAVLVMTALLTLAVWLIVLLA
ncbi:succinate dehydrogenase, cytochrome b556 subunit [Oleiagrimonas sp.]|jgi:succinate dehydrogenase / fumarate reductase cytochrome b subunit|uniref:succinate dehydrogenase, cytochrome b556 subunit n=1 Tax=Oleiagrimonas sp. TaxID=2010330 RepID=UPI0026377E79|nr:succinate dehydrogenase, cytochrome b556 subunit [Oleiagrimonas sp.]MDA3915302.1 succinate dehydrogenase, cytochrome b556 subunit [Oleiagrimonas sp.]